MKRDATVRTAAGDVHVVVELPDPQSWADLIGNLVFRR